MRRALLATASLLAACTGAPGSNLDPPDPPPPDPTPSLEDCPVRTWCWVRGRPMTVGGEVGRVFAIGPQGALWRWIDGAWLDASVPTPRAITSAFVEDDGGVWAVDEAGSAWHRDDGAWTERAAEQPIVRVLGAAGGVVWAMAAGSAGAHGALDGGDALRWDRGAGRWQVGAPGREDCLGGDLALVEGELWGAGLACDATGGVTGVWVRRFDGAAWQPLGELIAGQAWYPTFERMEGRTVVRAQGRFAWDGVRWVPYAAPPLPQDLALDEVALWDGYRYRRTARVACAAAHATADGEAWCFGLGMVYRADGTAWRPTVADPFAAPQLDRRELPPALWAGGDTDRAWRAHAGFGLRTRPNGRLEVLEGGAWTARPEQVSGVDGTGEDDAWAVSAAGLHHFDGRAWTTAGWPADVDPDSARAPRLRAIARGVALVTTDDALLRYDGAWTTVRAAEPRWTMLDVAGTSDDELWVTEVRWSRPSEVRLAHWRGGTWSVTALGDTAGVLTSAGGATWLMTGEELRALGDAPPESAPVMPGLEGARLWADADALWLTTPSQAVRWPRR